MIMHEEKGFSIVPIKITLHLFHFWGLLLLDDPFEKIDANRLLVVPGEDAFAEALDHAGLADGAIAYNHHLLHDRSPKEKSSKGEGN